MPYLSVAIVTTNLCFIPKTSHNAKHMLLETMNTFKIMNFDKINNLRAMMNIVEKLSLSGCYKIYMYLYIIKEMYKITTMTFYQD